MKKTIKMSIMATIASIANLPAAPDRKPTPSVYRNNRETRTLGKLHKSQKVRANRRKARRMKK